MSIYAVSLLAAASLDLSSPKATLLSYKRAIQERNWNLAEKCYSEEFRKAFKIPIQDRRLFDYYITKGFKGKTAGILPIQDISSDMIIRIPENKSSFTYLLAPKNIFNTAECLLVYEVTFRKESDGWKIEGSMLSHKDFDKIYKEEIPEGYQGSAKRLENQAVK